MGLGDLFSADGRRRRKIEKACEGANKKWGQSPDRMLAAEFLIRTGGEEAVRALLKRLSWTSDKSIEDGDEKDYVFKGLVHMGPEAVLDLLKERIEKSDVTVSWYLRVLLQICPPDEAEAMTAEMLHEASQNDFERDPQKRIDLIHFLIDLCSEGRRPSDRTIEVLLALVKDFTEDVRFQAVEALVALGDDRAREPLLEAFLEDESERVRQRILEGFKGADWDVKGYKPRVEAALPEGYKLDRSGRIKPAPSKPSPGAKSKKKKR